MLAQVMTQTRRPLNHSRQVGQHQVVCCHAPAPGQSAVEVPWLAGRCVANSQARVVVARFVALEAALSAARRGRAAGEVVAEIYVTPVVRSRKQ